MKSSRIVSRIVRSRILGRRPSMIGLGIIIAVLLFVMVGPFFLRYQPLAIAGKPNSPPSLLHPFGTDYLGHDLLSQVIYGAYPTLIVSIISALSATLIGFLAGLLGGYYGKLESAISGTTDVILSFPALVLMLLIGSMFATTDTLIAMLLVLVLWPTCARAIRAQVMSSKKRAYVDAARTSGLNDWKIVWKILAPEVGPIAIAYFVLIISVAIILVTALEFLGIGNLNEVSWGSILYFAQQYGFFSGDWWWVTAPGLLIGIVATAFALIGFSFEEMMNPRLRV